MASFVTSYGQLAQLLGFGFWMASLFAVAGLRKFERKIAWALLCMLYGWIGFGSPDTFTYGIGETALAATLPLPVGPVFVLLVAAFGPSPPLARIAPADFGEDSAQPSTDTPAA